MHVKSCLDSARAPMTPLLAATAALFILIGGSARAGTPGTFSQTGFMNLARANATGTLLLDGKVLIAGGTFYPDTSSFHYTNTAELYDPKTGTFTSTGNMTMTRTNHCAALLQDGRVLITGGKSLIDSGWEIRGTAEIYDPASGTFTATGDMVWAREFHTCTTLPSGEVLIAGGESEEPSDGFTFALKTAELYNPATGTFTSTGDMSEVRTNPFAALLSSGKVLVAGTVTSAGSTDPSAELYDRSSGTFASTGSMNDSHSGGTATVLLSSPILVAGGGAKPGSTQIYSVSSGTFANGPAMTTGRTSHTGTLLANGDVLLAGGVGYNAATGQTTSQASADLFDPSSNTDSATGSMTIARQSAVAVGLYNGQVLVAGGIDDKGNYRGQCDVYTPPSMPAVKIMWPIKSQLVSSTANIFTEVSSQVRWINLYIDGKYLASSPPYEFSWDSALTQNGSHAISVAAFNGSSQKIGSDSVTINVENP